MLMFNSAMMSGHGSNPIFFHKRIEIGRPEHSLEHSFLPTPTPPSTWTSYVYHHLNKDKISESLSSEI